MFSKLFKVVGLTLVGCLVVIILTLCVLFFKPTLVLVAVNKWTDYEIIVDEIQLELMPLVLQTKGLFVNTNEQTLVQFDEVYLSADWKGYLSGQHTIWNGDFSNGMIDLRVIPDSQEITNNEKQSSSKSDISAQLHTLLTALNGQIENLEIIINDQSSFTVTNLLTQLDGEDQQNFRSLRQNISLDVNFAESRSSLNLTGLLSVSRESSDTNVSIELSEIDLTEMISNNQSIQETDKQQAGDDQLVKAEQDSNLKVETSEAKMDWSWLEALQGLNVALSTPQLLIGDNSINEIDLQVEIDEAIKLTLLSANVDWGLNEQMRLIDTFEISGELKPLGSETIGADADVDLIITTPKFDLSSNGSLNLNSLSEQNVDLVLTMLEFPIEETEADVLSGILQQYLPISLNGAARVNSDVVQIDVRQSSFGESVFDMVLIVEDFLDDKVKLELTMNADKISFQSPVREVDNQPKEQFSDEETHTTLFSDAPIDFSFMQQADVNALINIKEFDLNELTIREIKLPITLGSAEVMPGKVDNNQLVAVIQIRENEKRLLSIDDMSANIAQGEVMLNVDLISSEKPTQLNIDIEVENLALESLSLMPQEQLSGGELKVDTKLNLVGDSLASLAAGSNGVFYLDVTDAVVQNDTFELIGSDLIFELLNKLNPFSKSDPTTDLKCATVYVPLQDGVAKLDDSIAVQTSKMVIVAEGEVDLNTEKVDVKFTPTSKAGLGVNVSSMVKFIKIGGSLAKPSPVFDAGGAVASGLAAGAAISTGGVSLLATGLLDKVVKNDVCGDVREQYSGH